MTTPKSVTADNYTTSLDDEEDTLTLTFEGEDGEKIEVTMDREMAEDFASELAALLGLDSSYSDD